MTIFEKNALLPELPISLSVLIGDIVIRFGELERALMMVYSRIVYPSDLDKGLEEIKGKNTLGDLIRIIREKDNFKELDWLNLGILDKLNKARKGIIHDCIMQESNGHYVWQSSSEPNQRVHRLVDYSELIMLRETVTRTVNELNLNSLNHKRRSKKNN